MKPPPCNESRHYKRITNISTVHCTNSVWTTLKAAQVPDFPEVRYRGAPRVLDFAAARFSWNKQRVPHATPSKMELRAGVTLEFVGPFSP